MNSPYLYYRATFSIPLSLIRSLRSLLNTSGVWLWATHSAPLGALIGGRSHRPIAPTSGVGSYSLCSSWPLDRHCVWVAVPSMIRSLREIAHGHLSSRASPRIRSGPRLLSTVVQFEDDEASPILQAAALLWAPEEATKAGSAGAALRKLVDEARAAHVNQLDSMSSGQFGDGRELATLTEVETSRSHGRMPGGLSS